MYGKFGSITGVAGTGLSIYDLKKIRNLLKRIKRIEAKLAEYGIGKPTGWTDKVDRKLSNHESRLTEIEKRQAKIEKRLDELTRSHNNLITVLNDRMKEIGNEFIAIGKKFAKWRVTKEVGKEFKAIGRKFKRGV